jgi:hypothetical protein
MGLGRGYIFKLWTAAAVAAEVGWAIRLALGGAHPILEAALVLGSYGLLYFTILGIWRLPEASAVIKRFL